MRVSCPWRCAALALFAAQSGCRPDRHAPDEPLALTRADGGSRARAAAVTTEEDEPGIDLTEAFCRSVIDTSGPVIDLGEPQAASWVQSGTLGPAQVVNNESWANVGARLRLRVPLDPVGLASDAAAPVLPSAVRFKVRRAVGRGVGLVVDGLLLRTAALPRDATAGIVSMSVPPEVFRRSVADIDLRFSGVRAAAGQAPPVAAQVDWVHLARTEVTPTRVADLLNDVAVEPTPRRALTFYPPTVLSTVTVLPPHATWTASLAAESPRGASRPPAPLIARLRAEVDGEDPIERRVEITPNRPWRPVSLDLARLAGRPARLSIAALEGQDARLAVSAPRIRHPGATVSTPRAESSAASRTASVRRVLLVVVRGARVDRFVPALSQRLNSPASGFARLLREGAVGVAQAPASREHAAMISAVSGLGADVHRVSELTDMLSEEAPTMASLLAQLGVTTRLYTDDVALLGSGADRGFSERVACANEAATCRPDWMFTAAAEALTRTRTDAQLVVVVTRAGVLPVDPTPENVNLLDPQPYEGQMTSARTSLYADPERGDPRRVEVRESREIERLGILYDASLLAVDRALGTVLERLHDQRLDEDTLVIVTGDRGTLLGEVPESSDRWMALPMATTTVWMARGPGFTHGHVEGVAGVVDIPATVIERFGGVLAPEMDGVSLAGVSEVERAVPFVANSRGELALRFGDLIALPRSPLTGGGLLLIVPRDDPYGRMDLAPSRPIARMFAETGLASYRPAAGRRAFPRTTRVLPAPLEATLRRR
jgi:hypothetical protein